MARKNNRRVLNGDGEWTYRCSRCEQYLVKEKFHNDKSKPPFNIAYNCKGCRRESMENPKYTDDVQEQSRLLLNAMGFNIKQNISEQFLERVKLKYGTTIE